MWPTNVNRAAFTAVMANDEPPTGHVDDPGNLIEEAFAYFTKCVTTHLTEVSDEDPHAAPDVAVRAERLRVTLCDLVKIVSITLEHGDNAQVIFETLNARGTPLLSLDLVKNALFRQAAADHRDTEALYENVWRPQLDADYWREERRQGRLTRPAGELFLMHWLTVRLERVIPATELFAMFRQYVLGRSSDAEALIRELCHDAEVMRSFDTLPAGSPERVSLDRLLRPLDAGTVLPLVLLLFRSPEITQTRRRRALHIIESWLARRALMRWTSKNYNRVVPRLIAQMKADLPHADDVLLAALSSGAGDVSRWPSDAEFIEVLRTRDMYGTVSQARIVMALSAVEMTLHTSKTEVLVAGGALTVEHLMPQAWQALWPLAADTPTTHEDGQQDVEHLRTSRIHRLGNLTIVASPLNQDMSNAAWTIKRSKLNEHTVLLLNSKLVERAAWDETAIDERCDWLASLLVDIWPGPGSPGWETHDADGRPLVDVPD